ncbi:MAG: AAA family ATPase [Bacteriovoracaceae bacterium]
MPHLRNRYIYRLLRSKLKFSPVIAIQGARQTGKSTLVRDILQPTLKDSIYITLDDKNKRNMAQDHPDTFLEQYSDKKTIIIDEAQKSPEIFDAVKLNVDQKRIPGKFILLGSTEFSQLTLIRESLTGRMSKIRLLPLCIAETKSLPAESLSFKNLKNKNPRITRNDFLKYMERGGMPGIFAVRNDDERLSLIKDWIELIILRDVQQFKKTKIDSELCLDILNQIAHLQEPNLPNITKQLKQNTKRVQTHLTILEQLFVINHISPDIDSSGKKLYFLLDVGLANYFKAPYERLLETSILQELIAQKYYFEKNIEKITYYRSQKGNRIPFVVHLDDGEVVAIKIFSSEKIKLTELEILKSFYQKKKCTMMGLGPSEINFKKENIHIFPWEIIV